MKLTALVVWMMLGTCLAGCSVLRDLPGPAPRRQEIAPLVPSQGEAPAVLVIGADGVTLAMPPAAATATASALAGMQPAALPVAAGQPITDRLPATFAAAPTEPAQLPVPATTETPSDPVESPLVTGWVEVNADRLNVRSGPGVDYPAVGSVTKGERLAVQEANPDGTWLHVARHPEPDGWVAARYVHPADSQAAAVPSQPAPPVQVAQQPAATAATPTPATRSGGVHVTSPSYGIAAHLLGSDDVRQAALDRVQELGFQWVKAQLRWLDYEGSGKGAFKWDWLDPIVAQVSARGLKLLISVVAAPEWARPQGDDYGIHGEPENPQDLGDFLAALVQRYPGQIGAVEVWNEQNLAREVGGHLDVAHYVAMLGAAYTAIKAVEPDVIVVSGGLAPTGTDDGVTALDDRRYLDGMLALGAAEVADAIGVHPSGYNLPPDADWKNPPQDQCNAFKFSCTNPHPSWSFRATLEDYHAILVRHGVDRQLWATEFGWAVCGVPQPGYEYCQDNTGWEQREWLRRAFELVKENRWDWVGVMVVWNLNYAQVAPGSDSAAFAILDASGNPTQAYEGLKGLPH